MSIEIVNKSRQKTRFKYISRFQKGRNPSELFNENAIGRAPYLSMEYLRNQNDTPEYAETGGALLANKNDVLLLWDGSNAGEFLLAKKGVVSSTAALALPTGINCRFFFYLCKHIEPQIRAETVGMGIPHVNGEFVGNLAIPIPKEIFQIKIADYLDKKTIHLDNLIAAKKKLILLLEEKKRTKTYQVLSRGINPKVNLKDSGIPWLGMIPEHWKVERTKWLLPEVDERSEDGSEELLTVSHLTGVTKRSDKDVNMFMSETLEGYKKCKTGDLVINTLWAWMGAMGTSPVDGVVSPAYNVYRPNIRLRSDYLDLLVRTPRFVSEITRYSKGVWSSRLRLYPEGLYKAFIPVPPIDEQKEIVEDVKASLNRFSDLQKITERTISLLQERRTALISAAVTGKLPEAYL